MKREKITMTTIVHYVILSTILIVFHLTLGMQILNSYLGIDNIVVYFIAFAIVLGISDIVMHRMGLK